MKKILSKAIALAVCLFSFSNLFLAQSNPTCISKPNVNVAFRCNGYYEYLPQGYNGNTTTTYPLIISFHGFGENGSGSENNLTIDISDLLSGTYLLKTKS